MVTQEKKISYKDLSLFLKLATLGGIASFFIYIGSFLIGFFQGLTS